MERDVTTGDQILNVDRIWIKCSFQYIAYLAPRRLVSNSILTF